MKEIRKYIRKVLSESVTPVPEIKKILDSDEAYNILDRYVGGTWTEGGCAILATALSKKYNAPIWVIYNQEKDTAEHFVIKLGNEKYMDYDGIHDNMIKDFRENELVLVDPLDMLPYKQGMNISDIVINNEAAIELYKIF